MRFYETLLAGAALAAAAFALEINDFPKEVEAGETYTVTYSPADDTPTTFILRKGRNEDLDTLTTLTETATNGEFQWTVDAGLADAEDYALEIRQGETSNFIGPIGSTGGTEASASASASSAASTGSASASASASASESTTGSASASATITASSSLNATISSATLTRTASTTAAEETATETGSEITGAGAPESTGAASTFASSPLALIFGAVAAMAYLN